ncbi:MAG: ankyrin repeat domain-containing protein [Ilumatobacter sp.]
MPLPPRPDPSQLRRQAKDRLRAARGGDREAVDWINEVGAGLTLSATQLRLARDLGFDSWSQLLVEVARRRVLDLRDPDELSALVAAHPEFATAELQNWSDHPLGASPLGYLAMARFDTHSGHWREVDDTAAAAHVLIAAGAPVDGSPNDRETPLITAASYGDADVAAVLVAAGADLDATAAADAGGVPGGTALLHAAVFGMTEVLDVLTAAGARPASFEEAAAVGDIEEWTHRDVDTQTRLRGLIMAADHQRTAVIDALIAAGTPFDEPDRSFGRHALRLAAANGRAVSVRQLLEHGADPTRCGADGLDPLAHCRHGRHLGPEGAGHDAVEELLLAATERTARDVD